MTVMKTLKRYLNILWLAIGAGMSICLGGGVYLMSENKILGAFLFSVGLCTILVFKFNLFTGMVGYIPNNKPIYILDVVTVWLGNLLGTYAFATLMGFTRIGDKLELAATSLVEKKLNDNAISLIILGVFCGLLMFIAVDSYKKYIDTKPFNALFMEIICVTVFILAGFEHSIADMFYFAAAGKYFEGFGVLGLVTLGNALGGMLIPVIYKISGALTKE